MSISKILESKKSQNLHARSVRTPVFGATTTRMSYRTNAVTGSTGPSGALSQDGAALSSGVPAQAGEEVARYRYMVLLDT